MDSCFSAVAVLAGAAAAYHTWYALPAAACQQVAHEGHHDGETEFANWSATHKVRPQQLFEPETIKDLQRVVAQCDATGDTYQQALQKLGKPQHMTHCPAPYCEGALHGNGMARQEQYPQINWNSTFSPQSSV